MSKAILWNRLSKQSIPIISCGYTLHLVLSSPLGTDLPPNAYQLIQLYQNTHTAKERGTFTGANCFI